MGTNIAVIGAGSWGTALVKLLSSNADRVGWWLRRDATIAHITKYGHNPDYISAAQFDVSRLAMSSDIHAVVRDADVLVIAVPSAFLKATMDQLSPAELQGKTLFSAVKGIVPETNQIVGEYLFQHWGVQENDFGVICGPCHAEEVAMERLSYLTIASRDGAKAKAMGEALNGRFMKTTLSDDIYGTEYAAILKNVIAVCSGISLGLGYGDNFRAVLVSRAIQEIDRFVKAVHPIARDINEPAYLGDLLVTAYSTFSRNRPFFGTRRHHSGNNRFRVIKNFNPFGERKVYDFEVRAETQFGHVNFNRIRNFGRQTTDFQRVRRDIQNAAAKFHAFGFTNNLDRNFELGFFSQRNPHQVNVPDTALDRIKLHFSDLHRGSGPIHIQSEDCIAAVRTNQRGKFAFGNRCAGSLLATAIKRHRNQTGGAQAACFVLAASGAAFSV